MAKTMLRIATRKSPLARWQANHVASLLKQHWPQLHIELVPMVTSGDRFNKEALSKIGGKGLFVKELEEALLDKRADFAVHSMKDVPAIFPEGLFLAAICERQNPSDALLCRGYPNFAALPQGAIVGTSSFRRQSQLLAARPDLTIKPLRGNIDTRIKKLQSEDYHAIVLAAAGLIRLKMETDITEILSTDLMLPACGQGAIGIECRIEDDALQAYLKPLNDPLSAICVRTERKVNALLGGNCHVPLAVYCMPLTNGELLLRAKVGSLDGQITISNSQRGHQNDATTLANACSNALLASGADDLLANSSTS